LIEERSRNLVGDEESPGFLNLYMEISLKEFKNKPMIRK